MVRRPSRLALTLIASTLCVQSASAVTVNEADFGGQFSGNWARPTEINARVSFLQGIGGASSSDFLMLSGLSAGAQDLTFSFLAPEEIGYGYAAGGALYYSTTPFRWGWDGSSVGSFNLWYGRRDAELTLVLGEDYAAEPLYLGFNYTHGENILYSMNAPASLAAPLLDDVAPIPLPATLALLLAAVGGLAGLTRRKRATT